MDSLYIGLPDLTITTHDGKIYGKECLQSASQVGLAKELAYYMTVIKIKANQRIITNIINIYDHVGDYPLASILNDYDLNALSVILKHKYPDLKRDGEDVRSWIHIPSDDFVGPQ